jgi:hypothetical protein
MCGARLLDRLPPSRFFELWPVSMIAGSLARFARYVLLDTLGCSGLFSRTPRGGALPWQRRFATDTLARAPTSRGLGSPLAKEVISTLGRVLAHAFAQGPPLVKEGKAAVFAPRAGTSGHAVAARTSASCGASSSRNPGGVVPGDGADDGGAPRAPLAKELMLGMLATW